MRPDGLQIDPVGDPGRGTRSTSRLGEKARLECDQGWGVRSSSKDAAVLFKNLAHLPVDRSLQ